MNNKRIVNALAALILPVWIVWIRNATGLFPSYQN